MFINYSVYGGVQAPWVHGLPCKASVKPPMLRRADMVQARRPKLRLVKTPTYVGVERVTILGPDPLKPVEGQVYVLQSDRSLRPINGKELVDLFSKYPGFVKRWRLEG
jgi:hypothetical protein